VLVQGGTLKVATTHDSVYSSGGSAVVKAPAGGFSTKDIGEEADVSAKYVFHKDLVFNGGFGHFFPGALMSENKHPTAISIAYLSLTYRLRFSRDKTDE
jgi:hypothetical protein